MKDESFQAPKYASKDTPRGGYDRRGHQAEFEERTGMSVFWRYDVFGYGQDTLRKSMSQEPA
jgi:hypothetical protein